MASSGGHEYTAGRVGVGVLNGLLYAVNCEEENQCGKQIIYAFNSFEVGEYDSGNHRSSSVECYSPETDTWAPIREMVLNCDFVRRIFYRVLFIRLTVAVVLASEC